MIGSALEKLGWGAWQEMALRALPVTGDDVPARIVRQEAMGFRVDTGIEVLHARSSGRLKHSAAQAADLPVVGDWVLISKPTAASAEDAAVHRVLPRRGGLARVRPGTHGEAQLMAANVDLALIVWSWDRDPDLRLIERAVVLARGGGVQPVVVLTKSDLRVSWRTRGDEIRARLYTVPVLNVSVMNDEGVDAVASVIEPGRTAAMIGPSGAGKSSLLNGLLGAPAMKVGDVRHDDRKGRHTTTHRELFWLPHGGLLIDGPGIRELGLFGDRDAIERSFSDVASLAKQCAYGSCRHAGEAGCAVIAAVRDGALAEQRLADYRALLSEAGSRRSRVTRRDMARRRSGLR
ncbi:MAG TPA: ribosome small subunit-dependent GTPase A [Polyangiaceae bacterium]|nr:ribosome small subunit-dependent GTPase A [Polyangiaceae bacterium]